MINPADMQNDLAFTPFFSGIASNEAPGGSANPAGMAGSAPQSDGISSLFPPFFGGGQGSPGASGFGTWGPLGGLLAQIGQLLQQFFSGGSNGNVGQFGNNQRFFQSASGSSTGDPHLSFNGNIWNNMSAQPNLLDSNSFQGGYSISTQTTQPNAQGITYNQQATVTSNYGMNQVSLGANGQASILQNGQCVPISAGQTIDLGNGETVTQSQNGSLQVVNNNGMGGSVSTTLSLNGNGVDVTTNANDVDLGGALVNGPNPWNPPSLPSPPRMMPLNRQDL